jgi:hypothetical protein
VENWKWGELNKTFYKIRIIAAIFIPVFYADEIASIGFLIHYTLLYSSDFPPVSATALTGIVQMTGSHSE